MDITLYVSSCRNLPIFGKFNVNPFTTLQKVREQLEAGNYKIPESEDPATLDHAAALAGNLVFLAFKYGSYDNISVTIKWL